MHVLYSTTEVPKQGVRTPRGPQRYCRGVTERESNTCVKKSTHVYLSMIVQKQKYEPRCKISSFSLLFSCAEHVAILLD